MVYGEIVEYLQQLSDYESRHAQLRQFLREVAPHFLTYSIMLRYATLRRQLRRAGRMIGEVDTLIAATALERGLTSVTSDQDFARVPDLKVLLIPRERLHAR